MFAGFDEHVHSKAETFASELNSYFVKRGIGCQLRGGKAESRGPEAFEAAMTQAARDIGAAGKINAKSEIHEALRDLSRRPEADLTGALHHALAALECVAREVIGEANATLGALLSRNKELIPPPLNVAVEKMWGFASEYGRHVKEGRQPPRDAVELVVHVAAAVAGFLVSTVAKPQDSASVEPSDEEIPF